MGNSQVHGDQTLVPTWKKRSGFTPRLIKYDGTTKKLIQSILDKWRVLLQSVSHVFLQVLTAPHEVMKQHTRDKEYWHKAQWNWKMTWKGQDFSVWWLPCIKFCIPNIWDSQHQKQFPFPSEDVLFLGPDLKRKIPVQTAKSTGPESQHPMTWANMAVTWLFIQPAVSGWQQEIEIPSWFVKILDTISNWGPTEGPNTSA